jgi:hypothetical protein
MKTQLLEDIGESAPLSLTPAQPVDHVKADNRARSVAPEGNVQLAEPGPAFSVWKRKPGAEPRTFTAQQPDQAPVPVKSESLFEEIAALEAQYVPPAQQQHKPAIATGEPRHVLAGVTAETTAETTAQPTAGPAAEPMHESVILRAGPAFSLEPTPTVAAPRDPLFELTPPPTAHQAADPAADPFAAAPTAAVRSRPRYLLWGACLLLTALAVQGARWLSHERNHGGSPVLSAAQAKAQLRADNALKRRTNATQVTPEPASDARATPVMTASAPFPALPPLVLLKPEPPPAAKPEQHAPVAIERQAPVAIKRRPPVAIERHAPVAIERHAPVAVASRNQRTAPQKLEHVVEKRPAYERTTPLKLAHVVQKPPVSRLPRPSSPSARGQSYAAAQPAREWTERQPAREFSRASAVETNRQTEQDFAAKRDYETERDYARAATLRACRAHGYDTAQCFDRACSVSRYGFSCRGQ